jgi:hypothetical protein
MRISLIGIDMCSSAQELRVLYALSRSLPSGFAAFRDFIASLRVTSTSHVALYINNYPQNLNNPPQRQISISEYLSCLIHDPGVSTTVLIIPHLRMLSDL